MKHIAAILIAGFALLNVGCVVEGRTSAYVAEPELAAFYEPPPSS